MRIYPTESSVFKAATYAHVKEMKRKKKIK